MTEKTRDPEYYDAAAMDRIARCAERCINPACRHACQVEVATQQWLNTFRAGGKVT